MWPIFETMTVYDYIGVVEDAWEHRLSVLSIEIKWYRVRVSHHFNFNYFCLCPVYPILPVSLDYQFLLFTNVC